MFVLNARLNVMKRNQKMSDPVLSVRGRDGFYSASMVGAMGRMCVADANSWDCAVMELKQMLFEQESECYAHEQSMTALSLENEV